MTATVTAPSIAERERSAATAIAHIERPADRDKALWGKPLAGRMVRNWNGARCVVSESLVGSGDRPVDSARAGAG